MPKSRGRRKQPAKRKPSATRTPPPGHDLRGRDRYEVGSISSSAGKIGGLLLGPNIAPDLMVELLPALLWLEFAKGHPTNLCVSSCVTLHYAYAALGIDAQPRAVDLDVHNRRTDKATLYGRPDPYWSGSTFHGHCVLWLPGSRRFIDPTVEQYPEVRRYQLGPICGPIAAATPQQQAALDRGDLVPGTAIRVERQDLVLLYTTVDQQYNEIVMSGPILLEHREDFQRSGRNLAGQALALLRRPDVIDRARQTPHARVRALLDLLADAEIDYDEQENMRFLIPDGSSRRLARRIDEIHTPVRPRIHVGTTASSRTGPHPTPTIDQETPPGPTKPQRRSLLDRLRRRGEGA